MNDMSKKDELLPLLGYYMRLSGIILLATVSVRCSKVEQTGRLTVKQAGEEARFGTPISKSAGSAIIGTENQKTFYFSNKGGEWKEETVFEPKNSSARFGSAVSCYKEHVLIGSLGDPRNQRSGEIVFYSDPPQTKGSQWEMVSHSPSIDKLAENVYVQETCLTESFAFIGVIVSQEVDHRPVSRGAVFVYQRKGEGWTYLMQLSPDDKGKKSDNFGRSISASGDHLLVGASGDEEDGAVYFFHYDGVKWERSAKIDTEDEPDNEGNLDYDRFGASVSIGEDYAVIGAPGDNFGAGSAYIFKKRGQEWKKHGKLIPDDQQALEISNGQPSGTTPFTESGFGSAVSIHEDYALVGSPAHGKKDQGRAYLFHFNGKEWAQQEVIAPNEEREGAYFGSAVQLGDTYCLIGAPREAEKQGAVYSFTYQQ